MPILADSLTNLSKMVWMLGRREESLAQAQKVLHIYEELVQARPDAFLPDLAMSLNNLATALNGFLSRREEALTKAQEAVRIYEQLSKTSPDAYLPKLAMSCATRGVILSGLSRYTEAAASLALGIQLLNPYFNNSSAAFAGLMEVLFNNYNHAIQQAKTAPDMSLIAPVMEDFKKFKQNQPKER